MEHTGRADRERSIDIQRKTGKVLNTKNSGVFKDEDQKPGKVNIVYLSDFRTQVQQGHRSRHPHKSYTAIPSNIPIKDRDKKPFGDILIPVAIRGPWGWLLSVKINISVESARARLKT